MTRARLIKRLAHSSDETYRYITPGLGLARQVAPSMLECAIYEPLVCLILQGQKLTIVGDETVLVSAGECIVVSHAMPVTARVVEASPETPYLGLVARIDVSELRSLHAAIDHMPSEAPSTRAFRVSTASPALLSVFERWADLGNTPDDAAVLAPLIRRELHYRLLTATGGHVLRMLLRSDSHASNISRAIRLLREDYRRRVEMTELAQAVGMSASSFYTHFKAVTQTTPLQYQKDLRLTEARRLVLGGAHSVSSAAHAVGYESASQFSREYSRKFGGPPRADLLA